MNVKLPSEVMVLGHLFRVRLVPDVEDLGSCTGHKRVITISEEQTQEQAESTLLHEIIHAALYVTGQSETLGEEREEGLVLAIEHALHAIYTRRKK